jgi:putative addiction module CopG family antidote
MPQQLPPDLEQRVRAQIDAGEFETEEDVLREALDTLEKRQRGLQELRQMVREADDEIAAGRVAPFDAEETKRAVRERLSQIRRFVPRRKRPVRPFLARGLGWGVFFTCTAFLLC